MVIPQDLFVLENKMKVLHIHPSMGSGGIESMITALANEMSKTEEVHVCSIFKMSEDDFQWRKLSDRVVKCHLGKTATGASLREIYSIYKYIKKNRFDAVYLCQLNYLRLSLHFNKMNIKCVWPGITVLGEQLVPSSQSNEPD